MTKEMKIQLNDDDLETIAGGADNFQKFSGYVDPKKGSFVPKEEYEKRLTEGEDIGGWEPVSFF